MRFYQFPKWFRTLYPGAIWDFFLVPDNAIYLTFDDGPHPETTPYILDLLDSYQIKATFFCLGENARLYPELLDTLRKKGHRIGNHGMRHLDGFKTNTETYLNDAAEAAKYIASPLYRPAYGHIKKKQFSALKKQGFEVVFWSLLTYDFDATWPAEKRLQLIRKKTKAGSILVFHDSHKALAQLKITLPTLLEEWKKQRFSFKTL